VNGLAVAALSLVAALVVTPMAMVAARRTGIVDRPGVLKTQTAPVPYLGGIGVFVGTAVGAIAGHPAVLVPLAAALALGICDDRFDLPPLVRLVGEVCIGVAVLLTGGRHLPGALAAAVVVVTVLLINGVNLLDGLDMLAAGVTAVAAVGRPDPHAGEVPVAFVTLIAGSRVTPDELEAWAADHAPERAAAPRHVEIIDEIPLTAVGKPYKPELRRRAAEQAARAAVAETGLSDQVQAVLVDGSLEIHVPRSDHDDMVGDALSQYAWTWKLTISRRHR